VPKAEFASRDYYDVWLPILSPSEALVREGLQVREAGAWRSFARRYRAQMRGPDASRVLDLLAALSHSAAFSVGCYCPDERRCHRSILRALLGERGAEVR